MTHAKALQAGHSSQGKSEPITPVWGATGDIGIANMALLVNVFNLVIDDGFNQLGATLKPVSMESML